MKLFVAPSWRIPISWSDPWGLAAASANTAETIEHGSDVEHVVDSLWLQICSACGRGQVVDCCRRERRHVAGQVENWNHWYASATSALWGLEHQVGRGQAGEVGGGGSNVDNGGLDGDHGSARSSFTPLRRIQQREGIPEVFYFSIFFYFYSIFHFYWMVRMAKRKIYKNTKQNPDSEVFTAVWLFREAVLVPGWIVRMWSPWNPLLVTQHLLVPDAAVSRPAWNTNTHKKQSQEEIL